MSKSNKAAERRRSHRAPTRINGVAKTSRGQRHALEITDLSMGGCAVVADGHPLTLGSTYGIKINGLETLGSVAAWTAGQSAGLTFEPPLHPAVADHLALLHPRRCEELNSAEA